MIVRSTEDSVIEESFLVVTKRLQFFWFMHCFECSFAPGRARVPVDDINVSAYGVTRAHTRRICLARNIAF